MIDSFKIFDKSKFEDSRGNLTEIFKASYFQKHLGKNINFVQDNLVESYQNSFRGLHYQIKPRSQGKYISVISGEVFDVIVDIRKDSTNFGSCYSFTLSSDNMKSLWVPPGFAHGFLTLSKKSIVLYKLTDFYCKESQRSIKWNSKRLSINWPNIKNFVLSEKDRNAKDFDLIEFD